jgi:predicted O-methyltransferase YrrM
LDGSVGKAVSELEATYQEYVTMVSRWDWAISLELAAVLMAFCRLLRPTRILDTGSGYSSYVLRRYAAEELRPIHVTSVDNDPEWLDETRGYLMTHGLSSNNTLTWDEFKGQDCGEFDLVLHDLGHEDERLRTLSDVLALVRPGGAVLLDDVGNPHMERYGAYARRMLSARRFRAYSLRALTRERWYSRYAMLGVRL